MTQKYELRLIGEYQFDEVASSLQKMIRRSKEYESCYWAFILHNSGFGMYVWRRLSIIACEDIGNATLNAPVIIDSLASSWERLHKHNKEVSLDKFLLVVQAVLFLCRAKKSRENDSLANLLEENFRVGDRLEIEEISLDSHTERGRKKWGKFGANDGKEIERLDRWFNINAHITNKDYEDKWEQAIKDIWYGRAKKNKT